MVKREGLVDKLVVKADGNGQVGHAGSGLLAGVADRVGLTGALSAAMGSTRQRRSAHNPGVVLRDLVVMLADGGGCLADLGAVRDQVDLYGHVASDSTAFRVIDSIDEQPLTGCVARSRCPGRGRGSWARGPSGLSRDGTVARSGRCWISTRRSRPCTQSRSRRTGTSRAATAIIRCGAISTGPVRHRPGSSELGTPGQTPPLITSRCSTSRSVSSTRKRSRGRSWCALTVPARRTS
jgi:Transposase DDE domain group 1